MLAQGYELSNRYQVLKPLGQGGHSNVYLLKDLRLKGKKWVGKEMVAQYTDPKDQSLAKKHFEQEANLLATLDHPNLPKVTDYFSQGGKYYLIMEYLQGEDLGTMIDKKKKPFTESEVANWSQQVATVLYYLHNQKNPIIFRDIKPSNIMICGGQVKLIDFGIARHFSPTKKGDTLRIGSPGYSPPEQYSGQTDQRSDIYSLGVTMHHLLTGQDPSATQTPFKLPPIRIYSSNVSPKMIYIVEKATQMDPSKRYQSALEMKKDLREISKTGAKGATTKNQEPQLIVTPGIHTVPTPPPSGSMTEVVSPQTKFMPDSDAADRSYETVEVPLPLQPQEQASPPLVTPAKAKETPAAKKEAPAAKMSSGFLKKLIVLLFLGAFIYGSYLFAMSNAETIKGWFAPPKPSPSIAPDNASSLEKGISLYGQGKFAEAIEQLKTAKRKDETSPIALVFLNNAYVGASHAESIKVSVLLCYGENDPAAKAFLSGLAVAQKETNLKGGIRGKRLILNIFRPSGDRAQFDKIIAGAFENQPVAVIIMAEDAQIKSAGELAETKKIPLLCVGEHLKSEKFTFVMHGISDRLQAAALGKLASRYKAARLLMVRDSEGTDELFKAFSKAIAKSKIKVVDVQKFAGADLNFDSAKAAFKKKKANGIIFLGGEPEGVSFVSAFQKSGTRARILLPFRLTNPSLLKKLTAPAEKLTGASPLFEGPENNASSNFIYRYRNTFGGAVPVVEAAAGYDALSLLAYADEQSVAEGEAAGSSSESDNTRITGFLSENGEKSSFRGAVCNYGPDEQKVRRYWAILEAEDGEWKKTGGLSVK